MCIAKVSQFKGKVGMCMYVYGWRFGLDQRSYSTLGPVSAWMGACLRAGKLSRHVTSHAGQLSLAIPLLVGA